MRVSEHQGWAVGERTVDDTVVDQLLKIFSDESAVPTGRGGIRNILDHEIVRGLARESAVRSMVESELGSHAFPCRAILFDKTPEANWKVVWHQDLTIAVRERIEQPGFGPWSQKVGTPHVQAPSHSLERMLAVRVHLDDCGADNGPLQVLPGSHRAGKLSPVEIDEWRRRVAPVDCLALRGSVLAFKPLLLHRSSRAAAPNHRRVVHLEFASSELPGALEWHSR